jgi:hypothetical protein
MFTAAAGASTIWTAEATPVAIVMASNNIMKQFFKDPPPIRSIASSNCRQLELLSRVK